MAILLSTSIHYWHIMAPEDEMWEMCLNLIQVMELLLGSKFSPETIEVIENKITRHIQKTLR